MSIIKRNFNLAPILEPNEAVSIDMFEFNTIYPNGVIITSVMRGNGTGCMQRRASIIHKARYTGIYIPVNSKYVESVIISDKSYNDILCCKFNGISGFFNISNSKKGPFMVSCTGIIDNKPSLKMRSDEMCIYYGTHKINRSDNQIMLKHAKAKSHPPIRLVVYLGSKQKKMWFIGYVRINGYVESYKRKNQKPISIFYLSLI